MISVNYECTCKLLSAGKLVSAMSFEDLVFCCHSVQIFIVISDAPEKKKSFGDIHSFGRIIVSDVSFYVGMLLPTDHPASSC